MNVVLPRPDSPATYNRSQGRCATSFNAFLTNHNSEGGTPLSNNLVSLVGQVGDTYGASSRVSMTWGPFSALVGPLVSLVMHTYGAGAAFGRHLDGWCLVRWEDTVQGRWRSVEKLSRNGN